MNQVANAQQNMSTIDAALNEIRQLLLQKEALQADVDALKKEKAQLSQEVEALRVDANGYNQDIIHDGPSKVHSGRRCSSLPDVLHIYDDDSEQGEEEDDDESYSCSEDPSDGTPRHQERDAPQHFYCPLTLSLMKHPMQQKGTSKNYERGAILEWIYFGKATCPLTRQKLHPSDFEANPELQAEIAQWRKTNGMTDDSDQDMDKSDISEVIKLTPQEEKDQQKRVSLLQGKRKGSTGQLLSLKDRVLRKRDDRIRRLSQR